MASYVSLLPEDASQRRYEMREVQPLRLSGLLAYCPSSRTGSQPLVGVGLLYVQSAQLAGSCPCRPETSCHDVFAFFSIRVGVVDDAVLSAAGARWR